MPPHIRIARSAYTGQHGRGEDLALACGPMVDAWVDEGRRMHNAGGATYDRLDLSLLVDRGVDAQLPHKRKVESVRLQ